MEAFKERPLTSFLILLVALSGLVGAAAIPFLFESASIQYKFGHDRFLLRCAQMIGMMAGYLLVLQIFLGARLKSLDRVFGLSNIFRYHRIIGFTIAGLVLMHPILIFISDNRIFIPLQGRYWPEFVGLFLLLSILAMVVSSQWRLHFKLPFHRWWPLHRAAAVLAAAAFWVHALSVGETFEQGVPRLLAFLFIGLCVAAFIWIRTRPMRYRSASMEVSKIEPLGKDAIGLQITSSTGRIPAYIPGQFGFLTCESENISREEHPFTIASSPKASASLEFIIRTTGDWTARLYELKPGDKVMFNGPFGRFSHTKLPQEKEIIMIAGGIGITPMLSMLRTMADCGDQRRITLIWSHRRSDHVILAKEFNKLAARLPGLRFFHVQTRSADASTENHRLDRTGIEKMTSDYSKSSAVFLCGPDAMMDDIYAALISIGFRKRLIAIERFSL